MFDMGDTLLGRGDGPAILRAEARKLGGDVDDDTARRMWRAIQERARSPEELAKGRDLSEAAHREFGSCVSRLLSLHAAPHFWGASPGLGRRLRSGSASGGGRAAHLVRHWSLSSAVGKPQLLSVAVASPETTPLKTYSQAP